MKFIVGAVTFTCLTAAAAGAHPQQVEPFRGPVDRADAMGGYVSSHIVMRLAPDVQPARMNDGRWTIARDNRHAFNATEHAIGDSLKQWQASQIRAAAPFAFANPELASQFGLDRYVIVHVPRETDTRAMVADMQRFATHIEAAEVDGIGGVLQTIPNDPSFNVQYGVHNTGQNIQGQTGIAGADVNAALAWDITTGSDEIIVAIVDTGVAGSHPDLSANMMTGYNAMNGSSDTSDSWLISHGTHVAGIAAARGNNGTGIAGVSWQSTIMPVKVLGLFGGGNETDIANGVIWAADNGAHVINMSLGVPEGITYFENAVNYAHAQGSLIVAATGNTPGAAIAPPARWTNVVAVGSTDNRDQLSEFTTTGPEMSVSAPGTDVYSTYAALFSGDYTYQSGTSMASPHVAGVACLVWAMNPSLSNDQVRAIIENTADDLGAPGWDQQFGHGRVNAYAAVLAVQPLDNDECDDATLVSDGAVAFSTSNASASGTDEPDQCTFFGNSGFGPDIWFEYEATCTGELTVSLCGSSYETKLGIYAASCPTGPDQILACDLTSCPTSLRSEIIIPVTAGEVFKIRIGGRLGFSSGDGMLTITCEPGGGPSCQGDLNSDGLVNVGDLLMLLSDWGVCDDPFDCDGDINGDGVVNVGDMLEMLSNWGACD